MSENASMSVINAKNRLFQTLKRINKIMLSVS